MSPALGHEPSDAPAKMVAFGLVGLLGLVGLAVLLAWGLVVWFQYDHPVAPTTGFDRAAAVMATPRLEVDARADRIALDRQAESRLTGYGWSDRAAGLAHIPVERAMALQAASGWPDRTPDAGAAKQRQGRP